MSTGWLNASVKGMRSPKVVWSCFLGLGGLGYLKVWLPLTGIAIPCVFHEVTGLYCPGCGMTRSVLALLKLDFYQSFRYNALLLVLLPLLILYMMAQKKQIRWLGMGTMAVMCTLTLGYGLLRNFPAFAWLAPTER